MTKVVTAFAWIAVIFFGLISAYALFVGLTFGFALWNADYLKPTWLWLGVVSAPIPIMFALKYRRNSPMLLLLSIVAACGLFAPYMLAILSR